MKVYEFIDDRGKLVVTDWDLQVRQRTQLDLKIDMLVNTEVDPKTRKAVLPPQLLVGPNYGGQQFIYKLRVYTKNVQLRPMVCLGPFDMDDEWTILLRATEVGDKTRPADCADRAEECRLVLLRDRFRRRLLREKTK